ncbi:MAG: DUF1987 domain-containing protein [Bacteroidota bacterium]
MEPLIIEATEASPAIKFDIMSNEFIISGKSRPENCNKFYEPVFVWLQEFEKSAPERLKAEGKPLTFTFKLEYFNSISAKYIADIILVLKELALQGLTVNIEWNYPRFDDDMLDIGQEFSDMVDLKFDYIPY